MAKTAKEMLAEINERREAEEFRKKIEGLATSVRNILTNNRVDPIIAAMGSMVLAARYAASAEQPVEEIVDAFREELRIARAELLEKDTP